MPTKAERRSALLAEIEQACPDVEPMFKPSPWQFDVLRDAVDWGDGCDPDGFFIGTCPLQKDKRRRSHLMRFNFARGVVQCTAGCHEGMGNFISIGNMVSRRG